MALQMQQTLAANVTQFSSHDRIQRFGAGEKSIDLVAAGRVPQMDWDTILPVATIGFEEAIHWRRARTHQKCYVGRTPGCIGKRPDRPAPYSGAAALSSSPVCRSCFSTMRARLPRKPRR